MQATSLKEQDVIARAAITEARKHMKTWQAFARILTRNPKLRLELTHGTPITDGNTIWIKVPWELGQGVAHDLALCGKRDEDLVQRCASCRTLELVQITVYHEVAHILFDTFEVVREDPVAIVAEAIRLEFESNPDSVRARALADRITKGLADGTIRGYMGLAQAVSPYLPFLLNCCEDSRVNLEMERARPGTKVMFAAKYVQHFERGVVDSRTGEVMFWRDAPRNAQMAIGVFCKLSGMPYDKWLSEEIVTALNDDGLTAVTEKFRDAQSVRDVYKLQFPLLEALRRLGFMRTPEEPEDDPTPPTIPDTGEAQHGDHQPAEDDSAPPPSGPDDEDTTSSDSQPPAEPSEDDTPSPDEDVDAAPGQGADSGAGSDEPGGDSDPDPSRGDGDESSGDDLPDDLDQEASPGDLDGDDAVETGGSGTVDPTGRDEDEPVDSSEDGDDLDGSAADGEDAEGSDPGGDPDVAGAEGDAEGDGGEGDPVGGPSGAEPDVTDEAPEAEADSPDAGSSLEDEFVTGDDGEVSDQSGTDTHPEGGGDALPTPDGAPGDLEEGYGPGLDPSPTLPPMPEDPDPYTEEDQAKDGLPDDVKALLDIFTGHADPEAEEDGEPEGWAPVPSGTPDVDAEPDEDVMRRALRQMDVFDRPSQIVDGVAVYRHNDGELGRWKHDHDLIEVDPAILTPSLSVMRRIFAANHARRQERALRSGKIDTRALGKRAAVGDDRVFKKRTIPNQKSYKLVIGIDCSGSNGYNNTMEQAKSLGMAMAELLDRLGIDFAVYAHTGSYSRSGNGLEVVILSIKEFGEPWSAEQRSALSNVRPMAANLDGHTLEYYRHKIQRERADHKTILYFTDGDMPLENYEEELPILQSEIELCKKLDIRLVGVGVGTDSPTRHGLDTIRVDSMDDIPELVKELQKRLV